MGIGKSMFLGFMGVSLVGGIAAPHVDMTMTPEEKLNSGKSYLAAQCSSVTRNRYINGKLGRGPTYCKCLIENVSRDLHTGDEYRYVAELHTTVGKERVVLQEARIAAGVLSVREKFIPKIGSARVAQINQTFFPKAERCTRMM